MGVSVGSGSWRVFQLVANPSWGGGEQYAYDLSGRLMEEGYGVTVVAAPYPSVVERLQGLGAPVHTLGLKGLFDVKSAVALARLLRAEEGVILHAHNFKTAFTAALARRIAGHRRCRVILTRHLVKRGKKSPHYRWLYRQLDHIIFVSELAQSVFLEGVGAFDRPHSVVHNGVFLPEGAFDAPDLRREYGIPAGRPILMSHGRLCEEKGVHVLIEALGLLQTDDYHLFLLGSGGEKYVGGLRAAIERQGLSGRVDFLGFQSPVFPYLAQADIGVLPSLAREACPLSCMDYLAAGKPQVASNGGAQGEIVSSEAGVLMPPGDAEALAHAIGELLADAGRREAMGRAGRVYFEGLLTYERFFERVVGVYFGG